MYIRKRGASRRRRFDMLAELEKHVVKITGNGSASTLSSYKSAIFDLRKCMCN